MLGNSLIVYAIYAALGMFLIAADWLLPGTAQPRTNRAKVQKATFMLGLLFVGATITNYLMYWSL